MKSCSTRRAITALDLRVEGLTYPLPAYDWYRTDSDLWAQRPWTWDSLNAAKAALNTDSVEG